MEFAWWFHAYVCHYILLTHPPVPYPLISSFGLSPQLILPFLSCNKLPMIPPSYCSVLVIWYTVDMNSRSLFYCLCMWRSWDLPRWCSFPCSSLVFLMMKNGDHIHCHISVRSQVKHLRLQHSRRSNCLHSGLSLAGHRTSCIITFPLSCLWVTQTFKFHHKCRKIFIDIKIIVQFLFMNTAKLWQM